MPGCSAPRLTELNSSLACNICGGYLIDATTIIECLHSFCRTCIVRYLETSNFCPACNVQVHETRPLLSIRSDQTLQDLVYKLVPGLYQNEMQKRREFYGEHPEAASSCSPEERGECDPRFIFPKETISIVLCHGLQEENDQNHGKAKEPTTRYLQCPAGFTVGHLKKFLQLKFSLPGTLQIDIFYEKDMMRDEFTLIDVAYIYSWKRTDPMSFSYCVSKRSVEPPIRPWTNKTVCSKPEHSTETELLPEDSSLKNCEPEPVSMDIDTKSNESPFDAPSKPGTESEKKDLSSTVSEEVCEPPKLEPSPKSTINSSLFLPLPEPTYNSVKLISAPEKSTLLSPTNGFRLKFIKNPELNPKSQKLKKSGRKSSKSSEHKYARVKLARLAPYPPPAVTVPCLTPQITMGKLVPTVITTLSPTVTSSLVSTAPRPLFNSSPGSSHSKAASFVNQSITSHVMTNNPVVPVSNIPVSSNTTTLSVTSGLSYSTSLSSVSCQRHFENLKDKGVNPPVSSSISPSLNIQMPSGERVGISECRVLVSDVSKIQDSSLVCVSTEAKGSGDPKQPSCTLNVSQLMKTDGCTAVTVKPLHSDQSTEHQKEDSLGHKPPPQQCVNSKPAESFERSVRNSISAEFSDSEDLGYPRDLVVDEQRMDSSDNEDEADKALRKKIKAIAEHEEEMDDTEADSGVSCATKSEDDTDSAKISEENDQNLTATITSVTSLSSSSSVSENHRQVKSNNINDVIKNLYRQHEKSRPSSPVPPPKLPESDKKGQSGVLDLSTCFKKTSECSTSRPRPVANPVLDLKHRQQTYLPAPLKQHTACSPTPKHSSSPLLLHHLTSSGSSILHNQLTNHPSPVVTSPFRPPPSPMLTGSFHPNLSPDIASKPGPSLLPGMMQYASLVNLAYSSRNMGLQGRTSPYQKDIPSPTKKAGQQSSARKFLDPCSTSKSNPQHLSMSSNPYPKPSPFVSMHSPRSAGVHRTSLASSVAAPSTSVVASQSKPPHSKKGQPCYKNFKFKGSNLAVYNPDPSGHRPKLVIKNLKPCPNEF